MTGFGSSCGACKFLRRKCTSECVFAPYFCYDEAATHFSAVHKVFGASNVSKLLLHLPLHNRAIAAITISYEALARIRDPVYGCVAHIFALQQQVSSLQEEVEILGTQMANLGVGIAGCENTQISSITSSEEMQFYPYQVPDAMDMQCYEDQAAAALLYHSEYSTGEQSFGWSKIPVHDWEDPNQIFELDPISLEGLLEGVDNDFFAFCSFLDTSNCIAEMHVLNI